MRGEEGECKRALFCAQFNSCVILTVTTLFCRGISNGRTNKNGKVDSQLVFCESRFIYILQICILIITQID